MVSSKSKIVAVDVPRMENVEAAFENRDEGLLQKYFSQILESVVSWTLSNTGSSLSQEHQSITIDVLVQILKKELHILIDKDDYEIELTNFFAIDAFVDALWLQTNFLDQPSSTEALVNVVKVVEKEIYEDEKIAADSSVKLQYSKRYLYTRLLESFDAAFLQSCEVIPSVNDLSKKLRVTNTAVNYRQYKFNILAEESEGYSKLLNLLVVLNPDDNESSTTTSVSNGPTQMIGSLISTFSLDPNRCLDLIVDVLEIDLGSLEQDITIRLSTESKRLIFLTECMMTCVSTGKLPQLLGFKLKDRIEKQQKQSVSHGLRNDETEKGKTIIRNVDTLLFCMTWMCFQNSSDMKPLLSVNEMVQYMPDNDHGKFLELLEATHQKIFNLENERIRNVGRVRLSSNENNNDDNNGNTKISAVDENLSAPLQLLKDQIVIQWMNMFLKVKIIKSLSTSGWELLHSVSTLETQWNKLAYLFPLTFGVSICDWVHEKVQHWLQQYDSTHQLLQTNVEVDSNNEPSPMDVDDKCIVENIPEKWIDLNIIIDTISAPLQYTWESGCIVHRPILYSQICRLLSKWLNEYWPESINDDAFVFEKNAKVITLLRNYLLPSLSLFLSNPEISMDIWNVVKQLPYRVRYSLYKSWKGTGLERLSLNSDKPLWLIEGELKLGKDARYYLKRLSKDTIREMSRAVAKCCHSHPLVVFTTILNQIESYDNLVQVMVEACRFVTPLSLDVLSFSILQRLIGSVGKGGDRDRLKENGVNVSQWLQSLESFTGTFFKRYPFIDFQGILCYLIHRIKDGQVMELGMLRTLLKTSGGWSFADYSPAASLSATQLDGRAGSTLLKRETMSFGIVEDINVQASNEVRRVLQNDNIGVSLLILLAQVRHTIVFEAPSAGVRPKPVKLLGNLFDSCQVVMVILLDFLTNSIDDTSAIDNNLTKLINRYAEMLPSLSDLLNIYKLDVASAWMLCRPLIRHATYFDTPVKDASDSSSETIVSTLNVLKLEESRKAYETIFPEATWKFISVDLFETFYTASLYDLFCPEDVYHAEIARLERDIDRLSRQKSTHQQSTVQPGTVPEKSDKEEVYRMKIVADNLLSDLSTQNDHVVSFRDYLLEKSVTFFPPDVSLADSAMTFLHRCVHPRSLQGPDDALYCAKFIMFLHYKETPGFSTLHFFDSLATVLSRSLFCLTEGEAACVSILLSECWKVLSRWRYDDAAFEEELLGKPTSYMLEIGDIETPQRIAMTKEDYRNLYNKWHAAVGAACIGCLQSSEYIHLRNCLVLLTRMVEFYPTRPRLANKLLEILEPLQEESNPFADIRASAQAYSMQLRKARDEGVWKEEDAATVKARIEKEQAAAEQRHRKAREQMDEIKRDQDKITGQIGDVRDRDRGRIRGGFPPSGAIGKSFDPSLRGRDDRRDPDDRRRIEDRRGQVSQQVGANWRDRVPVAGSSNYAAIGSAPTTSRREEGAAGRGLEGRWQRAEDRGQAARGSKRSRPSSPVEQNEPREEQPPSSKRARAIHESQEDTGRTDEASRIRRVPAKRKTARR